MPSLTRPVEGVYVEIKWVEDFLALNRTRNFTKAADSRNVTQPAFSRRIRGLEVWLGNPLFDRTSKPLKLTMAGERFVPIAEDLLSRAEIARTVPANTRSGIEPDAPSNQIEPRSSGPDITLDGGAEQLRPATIRSTEIVTHQGMQKDAPAEGITTRMPMVAVLPFSSLRGGEESVYLSSGLAQLVADELSRSRYTQVANQMKVADAYEANSTIEHVGAAVDATHCLDGTYMIHGDRGRLTARLLTSDRLELVWARRYDLKLDDIFGALEEIAGKIGGALSGVFERTVGSRSPSNSGPHNFSAFACFARGNYILRTRYLSSYLTAREFFSKAIESDPAFAKAYVGIAHTYAREYHTYPQRIDLLQRAVESASRAVELDPVDAYAQTWLAQFLAYSGNFDRSRYAAKRALELLPNDPDTLMGYGVVEFFAGNYAVAEKYYRKTWECDPVFMQRVRHALGHLMYFTRRFAEAEQMYEGMAETVAWNYSFRLATLGQLGREDHLVQHRAYFRSAFTPEQRTFTSHLFPFGDPNAVPLLIDGYKKAGIVNDVGGRHNPEVLGLERGSPALG